MIIPQSCKERQKNVKESEKKAGRKTRSQWGSTNGYKSTNRIQLLLTPFLPGRPPPLAVIRFVCLPPYFYCLQGDYQRRGDTAEVCFQEGVGNCCRTKLTETSRAPSASSSLCAIWRVTSIVQPFFRRTNGLCHSGIAGENTSEDKNWSPAHPAIASWFIHLTSSLVRWLKPETGREANKFPLCLLPGAVLAEVQNKQMLALQEAACAVPLLGSFTCDVSGIAWKKEKKSLVNCYLYTQKRDNYNHGIKKTNIFTPRGREESLAQY